MQVNILLKIDFKALIYKRCLEFRAECYWFFCGAEVIW